MVVFRGNLFCAHASITRVKTKDRPREPLVSKEMEENFLTEVKIIPARRGVQPSMSGPADSSVSSVQLDVLLLAPVIRSHPQSGLSFLQLGSVAKRLEMAIGLGAGVA